MSVLSRTVQRSLHRRTFRRVRSRVFTSNPSLMVKRSLLSRKSTTSRLGKSFDYLATSKL